MNPLDYIAERQYGWALRHGVRLDEQGRVVSLNDNLFLPLIPEAIHEYQAGAGQELQQSMRSLHSSSALVVNVFHYWRLYREPGQILSAISPSYSTFNVQDLRFEAQCPIAWPVPRGIPPHLDVVFRYSDQAEPGVTRRLRSSRSFRKPTDRTRVHSSIPTWLRERHHLGWHRAVA